MIKVFHIITHFDLGGAERIAINIAKSKNSKFEYHLVEVVKTNSDFRQFIINEIQESGIHCHCSPIKINKLGIILFPFWFIFLYLRHRPQIIHTHTEIPDLSVYLFHKLNFLILSKTKYIRTIHNTQLWTDWKNIGIKVEPFFIKRKSNISISKAVQNSYCINYKEKTPIIYNGISIPVQQTFKHLVPDTKNILFAGRFEYQKGINQLIETIKQLKDDKRYHFHIVGSGSLQNDIINNLQGEKNISIYETIYNLPTYFASFDYLFMPSNFEGLALTSIEASFSKTPTIINSCLGLKETLPVNWPLMVQNNSIEQYVHIFRTILPSINYENLVNDAYSYVKENFTIQKMQQQYEMRYSNLNYTK
jgi:glycosyltransferase involved in cell wall biosynthesis